MSRKVNSVAVTGALGNLGHKLLLHLAANSQVKHLIALDKKPADKTHQSVLLDCAGKREGFVKYQSRLI